MTDADLNDHIDRLHYLRIAALVYRDVWVADSTVTNWRRWTFARRRYLAAIAEGERRFGLSGQSQRQEGTAS